MVNVELKTRACDGHAVVALRGELDITGSADAASAIAAVAVRGQIVIVDLSALEFVDRSSLAALLRVQKLARQAGGDVLLATPLAQVQRLLTLTGMGDVFRVHVNVDAAVASLGGSLERYAVREPAVSAACSGGQRRCLLGPDDRGEGACSLGGPPAESRRPGFPAGMLCGRMRR
jgi:anti-sigma B factor antagonist